ncbi:MAG: hypothetical protein QOH15_723, partial [Gaiellales bacterium]|nr:hypothetical protein [Gaiellales bacterium]
DQEVRTKLAGLHQKLGEGAETLEMQDAPRVTL